MKTMKHEKLGSFFIAIGLVLAVLATPSASAYGAVAWFTTVESNGNFGTNSNHRASIDEPTRQDAIDKAKELCDDVRARLTTTPNLSECFMARDIEGEIIIFSADTPEASCVAHAGLSSFADNPTVAVYATGMTESEAEQNALDDCNGQPGRTNDCQDLGINLLATNGNVDTSITSCDTTILMCDDNIRRNIVDGICEPCEGTGTHVLVDEICEPIAECDADRQILNQTENECETCDFDKSPQDGECVCTDETLFNIAGTCTKPLTCIGNQIRDTEMPTRCINCEDKTANEERNLCEAACTGDNEVKDGEGDCRTCENDSIPNEENTECLPNCSNHDEYKDTDGFCVQCNTGLVASDNNDSCVAVPAVKTPSSKTGVVLGLVVLGVYAANVFAAPAAAEVAAINWTPSYAFRNNNGNISYSVGSRWTARTDNWRYYWQTTQSGGKFSYGSGMNYKTGIFAATMDSESDSDITDLDISLSATKAAGLWHFNGGYNLDAQLSPTEKTEMQNRLNIAARYSLDKWILSATANTDGERAAARINYSYRF